VITGSRKESVHQLRGQSDAAAGRARLACAVFLAVLGLSACSSSPATSSPSCPAQLVAWENTGALADLEKLPGQLDTTDNHVLLASGGQSLTAVPDMNAVRSDLDTLVSEGDLLAAHHAPACMPKLSADYATMLKDYAVLEKHLRSFIQQSGSELGPIAATLAGAATTLVTQDVAAVQKDMNG